MTDETPNPPMADADAINKRATLEADATQRQIKFDKRYSDKRLADMIAEHDAKQGGQAPEPARATQAVVTTPEPQEDVAALKAKLAAAEAALAAKAVEPAPQSYNAPKGMLTSMTMAGTGALQKEEDERRLLMEQATRLGIGNDISLRANNDAVREHITRHLAAKAQMQAIIDEQDRRRARAPAPVLVKMRVLPLGDGKISKGVHIPGMGDACYSRGDIIDDVLIDTAKAHERSGMGEIVGA